MEEACLGMLVIYSCPAAFGPASLLVFSLSSRPSWARSTQSRQQSPACTELLLCSAPPICCLPCLLSGSHFLSSAEQFFVVLANAHLADLDFWLLETANEPLDG